MDKCIVFMGTGPFALCALKKLHAAGNAGDRLIVYTKENKKSGRGMRETLGAVAQYATEHGLALYQPHSLRQESEKEIFTALAPDLAVVASYGLILPKWLLDTPRLGCINIHASLLPEYRGAAPIQRAIMDGKDKTGVTLMQMDEGLDTGDILYQEETPIGENDTAGDLFDRLAEMGGKMLVRLLPKIYNKELRPVPQRNEDATYAAKIDDEDAKLDFSLSSAVLLRRIRALSPMPTAQCRTEDGKLLKILSATAVEGAWDAPCGTVVETKPDPVIKTADGGIAILSAKPEGKGAMTGKDLVNGRRLVRMGRLL